ncbi:hypothetical protein GCM10015535_47200 [Streptomyces gelaticus]|uniref:Uncharacterized protein n=1 Tax=Streptomyces gelaticus TaxID=285446 RepID=A0ABQ2W3W1_9ACTN|nr:hypothetical protein GCM10015535_47200 [Streptomyces gelaticus]
MNGAMPATMNSGQGAESRSGRKGSMNATGSRVADGPGSATAVTAPVSPMGKCTTPAPAVRGAVKIVPLPPKGA